MALANGATRNSRMPSFAVEKGAGLATDYSREKDYAPISLAEHRMAVWVVSPGNWKSHSIKALYSFGSSSSSS
jgi:hypothetical protein